MIALDLADLIAIACRTLDLDIGSVVDLLDIEAAQTALAAQPPDGAIDDTAGRAAALLHGLVKHCPFRRQNTQIAVVATAQFLGLNGWRLDLDPPEVTHRLLADLVSGAVQPPELATWLAPRLRPEDGKPSSGPHRCTARASKVLVLAEDEARLLCHTYLGTEHLLLGLLREGEGAAAEVLDGMGVTLHAARRQVEDILGLGAQPGPAVPIHATPRAATVLSLSRLEAARLGQPFVGTEHLLLGLLGEGHGVAVQVLGRLGADCDLTRRQVLAAL